MTPEERIVELENNCKAMTAELKKLKAELAKKNETVWMPQNGELYTYITSEGSAATTTYYDDSVLDNYTMNFNNMYHQNNETKKHLEWYRDNVLRVQNKLMQLHELLCPDCFPDWDTCKEIWTIYYDNVYKCFSYNLQCSCNWFAVCFTREAAEKACEILNREKFMMEE